MTGRSRTTRRGLCMDVFDLPARLEAKADPALIAADEEHFAEIEAALGQSIAELSDRLAAERLAPGGIGQQALDRDMEIHRLSARLRLLSRYGPGLWLRRAWSGRTGRSRCRAGGSPSAPARGAACCSPGAPPRRSRSSARPTPIR